VHGDEERVAYECRYSELSSVGFGGADDATKPPVVVVDVGSVRRLVAEGGGDYGGIAPRSSDGLGWLSSIIFFVRQTRFPIVVVAGRLAGLALGCYCHHCDDCESESE